MNTEKIGRFIAKKRKEKNLTQKELALKLNITDRAVSKWERGMGCPDISLLEELSKILDISIIELLNGEEVAEINEKNIIDSMKFSKENYKNKIINNLNTILITIIIIIISILTFLNIINSINLNKKGLNNLNQLNIENSLNNIENKIKIIKNNKGKYSDDDYKKITIYINSLNKLFSNETKQFLYKKNYTLKDYYKFKDYSYNNFYVNYNNLNDSLYYTLIKYDTNIKNNMIKYERLNNNLIQINSNISNIIDNSYKYNLKNIDLMDIDSFLYITYVKEEQLLKDIIEVGDINV